MAKGKISFMTEAEIQSYERLLDQELAMSPEECARLLRSYRLAANVANAAWFVWERDDDSTHPDDRLVARQALALALGEYAPKHFPRVFPQQMSALQEMYNELTQRSDVPPGFLDYFFDAIMGLQG